MDSPYHEFAKLFLQHEKGKSAKEIQAWFNDVLQQNAIESWNEEQWIEAIKNMKVKDGNDGTTNN